MQEQYPFFSVSVLTEAIPGLTFSNAETYHPLLLSGFAERNFSIRQIAHFLAQTGHETSSFAKLREIWGPTAAQSGYEGRTDLGNTEKGDGFKFRGRGLIHITGRYNYKQLSKTLFDNDTLLTSPESLEKPPYAVAAGFWFWDEKKLATYDSVQQITYRVNAGTNGLPDRNSRFERALHVLLLAEFKYNLQQVIPDGVIV
jgi:putative chitinase